jgi:hypothetical protein
VLMPTFVRYRSAVADTASPGEVSPEAVVAPAH